MMTYILAYCELLLLSLVGIAVCGCIQNLHRYVCKLIGSDEVLVVRVDSELFLLAVVTCHTIGGGSFHLHCIVLI